jgi:putative hydrolase of the HAD superfamily
MRYTPGIQQLIFDLKNSGFKLYVLSNMPYHFIEREYKFPIFKEFDGIVYSAPIKLLKPNPKIYEYILNKFNLNAQECLFIDDIETNLTAAARFGIHTFHFEGNTDSLREFILTF